MLKKYSLIKAIAAEIGCAAEIAAHSVLGDFSDIEGREEEITAQLRGEINRRLLEIVKLHLNGAEINDCLIRVATFKKSQESEVGA